MVVEKITIHGKAVRVWIPKHVEEEIKEAFPEHERPWDYIINALSDEEMLAKGEPKYAIGIGDTLYVLTETQDGKVTAWYYDPQFDGVAEVGTYNDPDDFIEKTVKEEEWTWDDVRIEAIILK